MKKFFALFLTTALLFGLCSCGDDPVLSASSAKKALKKEAVFSDDYATVKFNTGYYEIDEDDLVKLLQLKAAGMITLSTETIVEKVTKRNYSYWSGYSYYTVDNEHLFANVQLTEEGKKLEIEEPTTMRSDIVKDLKPNEDYEEAIPDYMTNYGTLDAPASKPEVKEVTVKDSAAADSVVVEETTVEVVEPEPVAQTDKKDPNAAYNAAVAKVYTEEHNMLLGHYELVKVKLVRCTEEMAKNGQGECEALITFRDKTPFGFVYHAPKQDYISTINVKFLFYQDMGWLVKSIND